MIVQARESTPPPFSPLDYDPVAWYRSDAFLNADGNVADSFEAIATFHDLSGNGYHATQGTPSARPTMFRDVIDGRNIAFFDGSDDFLTSVRMQNEFVNGLTAFVVISFVDGRPSTIERPWGSRGAGSLSYLECNLNTGGTVQDITGTGTLNAITYESVANDAVPLRVYSVVKTPDVDVFTRVNGGNINTRSLPDSSWGNITGSAVAETLMWGARSNNGSAINFCNCFIPEIILYGKPLSNEEREEVEAYLFDLYPSVLA